MSRIALGFMLFVFAMGACAQAAVPADAQPDAVVADQRVDVIVDGKAEDTAGARCVRETGSRIRAREKGQCLAANGVSYGNDDLERTGRTDAGEALESLDPSISTR